MKFNNIRYPDALDLLDIYDGKSFELAADFRVLWTDGMNRERSLTVHKGYITDLSSIPRWAQAIVPKLGRQNRPSVIHDFIYEPMNNLRPAGQHQLEGWTKEDADEFFRQGMIATKTNWYRRNVMYAAVKYAGTNAWATKDK